MRKLFVAVLLLLDGAGCINQTVNEHEVNNGKLQIIGAYNQVVRWRRESENSDILPDITIVHALGGNYDLIKPLLSNITAKQEELRLYIESADDIPMWVKASTAYYSLLKAIMSTNSEVEIGMGTCGSFITSQAVFSDEHSILNYVKDPSNSKKPAGKLFKEYLKNFKNEQQFEKNMKILVKKNKVNDALDGVHMLSQIYLKSNWTGNEESMCESDLSDFKALIALDESLQENLSEDDVCNPRLLITNISLESALNHLDEALADNILMNSVFVDSEATLITEQYDLLKKVSQNSLALLSMRNVRDMIIGNTEVRLCENCNCKMQYKILKFQNSIQQIRNILPSYGSLCKESWDNIEDDLNNIESMQIHKEYLEKHISQIQGIDDVFEIFSTSMIIYQQKAFVGVPFKDLPVKLGIWLVATHLFSYDTCQQFRDVQILNLLLEQYSKTYYMLDFNSLKKCGLLPSTDTEDSIITPILLLRMILYDMFRKYNFEDLVLKLKTTGGSSTTYNEYESVLYRYFYSLMDEELSVEPHQFKDYVDSFPYYWPASEQLFWEDNNVFYTTHFLEACANCELLYTHKATIEHQRVQFMNYAEGRHCPLTYEQEIYATARQKYLARDESAFSECQDSVEIEFKYYLDSLEEVVLSDYMNTTVVFEAFKWTLGLDPSDDWTPQKLNIAIIYQINDVYKIYDNLNIRLQTGNWVV